MSEDKVAEYVLLGILAAMVFAAFSAVAGEHALRVQVIFGVFSGVAYCVCLTVTTPGSNEPLWEDYLHSAWDYTRSAALAALLTTIMVMSYMITKDGLIALFVGGLSIFFFVAEQVTMRTLRR